MSRSVSRFELVAAICLLLALLVQLASVRGIIELGPSTRMVLILSREMIPPKSKGKWEDRATGMLLHLATDQAQPG